MTQTLYCKTCGHPEEHHTPQGRCMVQVIVFRGKSKQIIRDIKPEHMCKCENLEVET